MSGLTYFAFFWLNKSSLSHEMMGIREINYTLGESTFRLDKREYINRCSSAVDNGIKFLLLSAVSLRE